MSRKNRNSPFDRLKELPFDLYRGAAWRPSADLYRYAEGLLVKLELAGVVERDLRVTLQEDMLIVEGRRRDWCVPDAEELLSMEITYDRFRRTVHLPAVVDPEPSRLEYRDGMLLVHLRLQHR